MFERHQEIMERRKSGEGSEGGFTLIELLIVIVVLGILAAIVVFSLTGVSRPEQAGCVHLGREVGRSRRRRVRGGELAGYSHVGDLTRWIWLP